MVTSESDEEISGVESSDVKQELDVEQESGAEQGQAGPLKRVKRRIRPRSAIVMLAAFTAVVLGVIWWMRDSDPATERFKQISAVKGNDGEDYRLDGVDRVCAVTVDGELYCKGDGGDGQIGNGKEEDAHKFERARIDERVKTVSTGGFGTCAIAESGSLYCWGSVEHSGWTAWAKGSLPVRIPNESKFVSVSVGNDRACGVSTAKKLFCWGASEDNTEVASSKYPERTQRKKTYWTVKAGRYSSAVVGESRFGESSICALGVDGRITCWGKVPTGLGIKADLRGGRRVVPLPLRAEAITEKSDNMCALLKTSQGGKQRAYCWGRVADDLNDKGKPVGFVPSPVETPSVPDGLCFAHKPGKSLCVELPKDPTYNVSRFKQAEKGEPVPSKKIRVPASRFGGIFCFASKSGNLYCDRWATIGRSKYSNIEPADNEGDAATDAYFLVAGPDYSGDSKK